MAPHNGRQVGAFIPLVVAAGYAVVGLWQGSRFMVAGAVIAGLTLGGYFLVPAHFDLWMAGRRRRRADPGRVLVPQYLKWNSPTLSFTSRCASRSWPR